jgi:hypothetical protein
MMNTNEQAKLLDICELLAAARVLGIGAGTLFLLMGVA